MPVRHGDHARDAGIAQGGRRAQTVAVEREEFRVEPLLARRFHEERQIVAPVAGDHGIRPARPNLGDVRRKILHAADRMKLVARDRDIRAPFPERALRLAAHVVAEAVILIEQIDLLHRAIGFQRVGERVHAHAGVRVEAEMPEAARVVGERGVVSGIVEKQHATIGFARVLLVDCRDERRRHRRAVALHDEADLLVERRAQLHETRLAAALAVEYDELQRMRAVGERHAAARVHQIDAEAQIALDHRAGVGERAGHAFDQR
ncbi:hypothetical protein AWB82_06025 [Caballeronia glebae]|uniref:Uncharacterized protein n=1 Tax=Caballeronia glebae TaxID=1777143 RepID=A0A158CZR1_9BURK|nr:hypothetical protein AWB82_06025 [Caballeronia glebae]